MDPLTVTTEHVRASVTCWAGLILPAHSRQVIALCFPDLARTWGESSFTNKLLYFFIPFRQKLILPSGSCPVILNTYFCQKIVAQEDSKTTHEVHGWNTPLPRRNITLAQMFRFNRLTNNSPESQVNFHLLRHFILCNNVRFEWVINEDVYLPSGIQQIYRQDYLLLCLKKLWFSSVLWYFHSISSF